MSRGEGARWPCLVKHTDELGWAGYVLVPFVLETVMFEGLTTLMLLGMFPANPCGLVLALVLPKALWHLLHLGVNEILTGDWANAFTLENVVVSHGALASLAMLALLQKTGAVDKTDALELAVIFFLLWHPAVNTAVWLSNDVEPGGGKRIPRSDIRTRRR